MLKLSLVVLTATCFAPMAAAQTISLSCAFNGGELSTLKDEGVIRSPAGTATAILSLNFDTRTFVLQSTGGHFTVAGDVIVMMARRDNMLAMWEINRLTGNMQNVGSLNDAAESVFIRQHGVCTHNGVTPF